MKNKRPIYMDMHATTPVDPRVLEAMLPCLGEIFGNPSSQGHVYGWEARELVESARAQVAELIGAEVKEILFTSGATESNNLALQGIARMYREKGQHLITQVTEHKSVLEVFRCLEKQGFHVTYLKVDSKGRLCLKELEKAMRPETLLISIMHANNEIGTLQPIQEIGRLAKEKGIFFHVDGAQSVGKIPCDVESLGIDLLSFSGHKMYGPKGIGALYVRSSYPRVRLSPLFFGGGHESKLRSGTLNVPGIVGLGKACSLAKERMEEEFRKIAQLRDELEGLLQEAFEDLEIHGDREARLPNNLSVSFSGIDSESLLTDLQDVVAVSTGSACTSGSPQPSYVLKALGLSEKSIHSSVRFGLGRSTTSEEVRKVAHAVIQSVHKLRRCSAVSQMDK